jgi:hypothetical protein
MTKNCVRKTEGHREITEGFENLSIGGETDRSTDRKGVTNFGYENPSLFCHTLCYSFLSVIHGLYISLSATIDWAWGARKLLYSWYRFTFVGEILR